MALDKTQKMAIAGVGLVAAGAGLGLIGAALIAPAFLSWAASAVEKGTDRLASNAERTSRIVGSVVGTLQRSFVEATRAGWAEGRRNLSDRSQGAA
jgi:hypothetical protein